MTATSIAEFHRGQKDSPQLSTVKPTIERDRWGRPKIILPDGDTTHYTRVTTLAGTLDDTFGLAKWQRRQTAIGLAARDDLLLSVKAADDGDTRTIDQACDAAMEAAGSSSAATIGTALHSLTERLDLGTDLPTVDPNVEQSMKAYIEATSPLDIVEYDGEPAVEQFLVCDDVQAAGTADRIVTWPDAFGDRRFIADLKTGKIRYGALKIAMQLAIYAHGQRYDPATGDRSPIDVDLNNALIIHLPAGGVTCRLWWVDIKSGWEAVQQAVAVRAWRKRRDLTQPAADEIVVG